MATVLAALLSSCTNKPAKPTVRSVYYWATTLDIDSTKADFLSRHKISRMYIRFFDVVQDASGRSIPNATIQFASKPPTGIDIIPTVFVLPECLHGGRKQLAKNIVRRVRQMCATNDIGNVGEIQIDCDWTASTRLAYRDFMQDMLDECHGKNLKLSSTIRLHQLAQAPPPADRGVLMMYNTGNVADINCHKPILDLKDAAPYLGYLSKYPLPLATAYPVFAWRLLFRGNRFIGIIHYNGEYPMLASDSIARREPTPTDIIEAIRTVGAKRADANNEIIMFDLSNNNIKRIKPHDYEKFYNP